MEARLTASVLATSLMRRAESQGGFATVVAKGDPTAGSILIILNERGGNQRILERLLQADGRYSWRQIASEDVDNIGEFDRLLARRRKVDPDLWLIELNVPSAERFGAVYARAPITAIEAGQHVVP